MTVIVTQRDVDEGVEFYCLCHGWHRLAALDDFCPMTYASAAGRPPGAAGIGAR